MSIAACTAGTISAHGTPPGPLPFAFDPIALSNSDSVSGFRNRDQSFSLENLTIDSLSRTSSLVNRTHMPTSDSLLEAARMAHPGHTDLECVAEIAAKIIDDLGEEPPISLEVVASYRDIADVKVEPLPFAGSLTPEANGLVMRLNAGDSRGRRRFSGFHEVGHTFQPGFRQMTLFRCDPSPTRTTQSQPEQLADAAAAELLLPRRFFAPDLMRADVGWDGVEQLATHYDASLSATALRAVHLATRPTLLVVLEPGVRKEERGRPGAAPKLRVTSSASNSSYPFVPHNKSAAADGVLDRAFNGEIVEDATTLDELGISSERLHVSARLFPYTDQRGGYHKRVMALFWQDGQASAA